VIGYTPADGYCCRGGFVDTFASFCESFVDFALEITTHGDSGHNYCAAAEHDIGLAFDVGFAGDFVACVLVRFVSEKGFTWRIAELLRGSWGTNS
jgi:hypothetical protein